MYKRLFMFVQRHSINCTLACMCDSPVDCVYDNHTNNIKRKVLFVSNVCTNDINDTTR